MKASLVSVPTHVCIEFMETDAPTWSMGLSCVFAYLGRQRVQFALFACKLRWRRQCLVTVVTSSRSEPGIDKIYGFITIQNRL